MKEEEENPEAKQLGLFPGEVGLVQKGKDEMNLAEFPIAAVGHRIPEGVFELTYEDEITDSKTGKIISRSVTIKAPPSDGLPTSLDDEVILAFVNLWKLQGANSKKVLFTRHQIIKILGWANKEHYYKRITASVNRWTSVSLHYKNAWWDKLSKEWVDGAINLVDSILWAEKRGGYSELIWGEKIYESLMAGNIKSLDLERFRELKTPTARRIYRFLDKRFYLNAEYSEDLRLFARSKIGLSGNYNIFEIKRQLNPAISQLEKIGFIKPLETKDRYIKIGKGMWRIYFHKVRNTVSPAATETATTSAIEQALIDLGVTRSQAEKLADDYPTGHIIEWINVVRFLNETEKRQSVKNPAGYINKALIEEWPFPSGFKTADEKAQEKAEEIEEKDKKNRTAKAKKDEEKAETKRREEQEKVEMEQEKKVDQYLDMLSKKKRALFLEEIYAEAREAGEVWIDHEGVVGKTARSMAVSAKVLKILG